LAERANGFPLDAHVSDLAADGGIEVPKVFQPASPAHTPVSGRSASVSEDIAIDSGVGVSTHGDFLPAYPCVAGASDDFFAVFDDLAGGPDDLGRVSDAGG
jgi:hypothetical protein